MPVTPKENGTQLYHTWRASPVWLRRARARRDAMKKSSPLVLVFGILFLFIIQSAGTLVESIYILDLMNSKLDEKALGVLFFFAPLLLLPFFRYKRALMWVLFALLFITRGLTPYLGTTSRMAVSGIATAV